RKQGPMLEQVLDLDRRVERDVGPSRVQLARDPQRVRRAVEEVRIPEADVPCPRSDLLCDVRQYGFSRHRDEAAAIHGNDGAVPAEVLASLRGIDGGDQPLLAVPG